MFKEYQENFLTRLRTSESLILVEGKNDSKVLHKMGLKNIVEISGKQLEKVADLVKETKSQVIILTDYDKEGISQYKRLKELLMSNDIKIDDNTRRDFRRIFLINRIEELSSYFK